MTQLLDELQQTEDIALFRQELPRWKERSAQALFANVSQGEAKAFRRLSIDLHTSFVTMHDPLADVIAEHRAFLKALRNSILRSPSAYGPEAAAAERQQKNKRTTNPTIVRSQSVSGVGEDRNASSDGIELERIPVSHLLSALGRLTFGSWMLIVGAVIAVLGIAYGLGVTHGKDMTPSVATPADTGFQGVKSSEPKPQSDSRDSSRERYKSTAR